jgi:nucleoside-diphosphate-sugar epimerase
MSYFCGKTVLITGATGLIGSHLAKNLIDRGDIRVIALGRSIDKLKDCFADHREFKKLVLVAQDIVEPLRVDERIDIIFHAASPIAGNIIANSPLDVIYPNLIGTQRCFDYIRIQKERIGLCGRIVLFSSATVYGNLTNTDLTATEEDTEIAGALESANAPYFESKRMVEVIARAHEQQHRMDTVIARPGYVYGSALFEPQTAFYEFLNKAIAGEDITLNSSGYARRDNIYIEDAVKGLLTICEKGQAGEAYNISSNKELGNYSAIDEIAEKLAEIAGNEHGREVKVVYRNGNLKSRAPGINLDNSKLKSLGWELEVPLFDGIKKTFVEKKGRRRG